MADAFAYDPLHPDTVRDPYAAYARLREHGAVVWYERLGCWLLTRHRHCVDVFRDARRFASDPRRAGRDFPSGALNIQTLDPPEHGVLRRLMVAAYREQDMKGVEHRAAERAAELLDAFAGNGGGEVMKGLAAPLALSAICDFLGVPEPDPHAFGEASDAIVRSMDAGLKPELAEPGGRARAQLAELVAGWFDPPPERGMVGFLARHAAGEGIAREVLYNTVRVAFHAGYTSVYSAIGNALLAMLRHADDWTPLRDPSAREGAVEELFRFDGPVQVNSRIAVEDVEIGGVPVRRGQTVLLMLGAANRDPEAFPSPDQLLFARQPNPHLAFGWGTHACIGGSLAKMVVRVALAQLAGTTRDARVAGEVEFKPQATQRCLDRLPIACAPAHATGP